jgi:hypothetical protein
LLGHVNPKTNAKKCDRIRIAAILRLDDDENGAGLLLVEARCFVEQELARISSGYRPDARNIAFRHSLFSRIPHTPCSRRRRRDER